MAFAFLGCQDSPERAIRDLTRAGAEHDLSLIKSRVTKRSLALIELTEDLGRFQSVIAPKHPVDIVRVHYPARDVARITARVDGRPVRIPLIKEHGRWKVDLLIMGDMLRRMDDPMVPSPVLP